MSTVFELIVWFPEPLSKLALAVLLMVVPASVPAASAGMGVISEVIAAFSRKPVFGYKMVAIASLGIALVGFLVAMFWHAQLGVQVVIEDYVHSHGLALAAQIAVRFLCILGALASVFAVVIIALGGV